MNAQRYSFEKDYTFLNTLQRKLNTPWYVRLLLLFIPKKKYATKDFALYYKMFRDTVYILEVHSIKDVSRDELQTMWDNVDTMVHERPYAYTRDHIASDS